MGINDLWSSLGDCFDKRISIPVFLADFFAKYKRSPRLAIDIYSLIYNSIYDAHNKYLSKIYLRNIISKLLYLTQNGITYVVVFDGRFKPMKRRNYSSDVMSENRYDQLIESFVKVQFDPESYCEEAYDLSLIEELKAYLKRLNIDFLQAPGEAEAECASLQKFGVVDYVLTHDNDVLVFGATKVLRDFSKNEDARVKSPSSRNEYYVTPIYAENIENRAGIRYQDLIFIAAIRGGDYSKGLDNMGITRAVKLACFEQPYVLNYEDLCFLQDYIRLSDMLLNCFIDENIPRVFKDRKKKRTIDMRRKKLKDLEDYMNNLIKANSKKIFGKTVNFKSELSFDEDVIMFYVFPITTPYIFRFLPGSLSFYGYLNYENDLALPSVNLLRLTKKHTWEEKLFRCNQRVRGDVCGHQKLNLEWNEHLGCRIINSQFKDYSRPLNTVSTDYDVLDVYPKVQIAKDVFSRTSDTCLIDSLKVCRTKIVDGHEFLMIKSNPAIANMYHGDVNTHKSYPSNESLWLPRCVVLFYAPSLTAEFDRSRSYKLDKPLRIPQLTTLESLGFIPSNSNCDREKGTSTSESPKSPRNRGSPRSKGSPKSKGSPQKVSRNSKIKKQETSLTNFQHKQHIIDNFLTHSKFNCNNPFYDSSDVKRKGEKLVLNCPPKLQDIGKCNNCQQTFNDS